MKRNHLEAGVSLPPSGMGAFESTAASWRSLIFAHCRYYAVSFSRLVGFRQGTASSQKGAALGEGLPLGSDCFSKAMKRLYLHD